MFTVNEIRATNGLPPIEGAGGDHLLDPNFLSMMSMQKCLGRLSMISETQSVEFLSTVAIKKTAVAG